MWYQIMSIKLGLFRDGTAFSDHLFVTAASKFINSFHLPFLPKQISQFC